MGFETEGSTQSAEKPIVGATSQVVQRVRSTVESILERSLQDGTMFSLAAAMQGNHTTLPERVHPLVSADRLFGACKSFSHALQDELGKRDVQAEMVTSETDVPEHFYLELHPGGLEVIIDPTIGQYVKGHNHAFVGTREQLRNLVVNRTGEGEPYSLVNIYSVDPNDKEKVFDHYWGSASKPAKQGLTK